MTCPPSRQALVVCKDNAVVWMEVTWMLIGFDRSDAFRGHGGGFDRRSSRECPVPIKPVAGRSN